MPGVNPVEAVSGSTTSSAPVASTHRSTSATQRSTLDLMLAAVNGPGAGATWIAAAVNAFTTRLPTPTARPSSPACHDRTDQDAEQGDDRPEGGPDHEVPDPLPGRVHHPSRRVPHTGRRTDHSRRSRH